MTLFPSFSRSILKNVVVASSVIVLWSCGGGGGGSGSSGNDGGSDNGRSEPDQGPFLELTVLSDSSNDEGVPLISTEQDQRQFTIGFPIPDTGTEVEFYLEPQLPEGTDEGNVKPLFIYAGSLSLIEEGTVNCIYKEDHSLDCTNSLGGGFGIAALTVEQFFSGLTTQYNVVMHTCASDDDCTETATTPIEIRSGFDNQFTNRYGIDAFEFEGANINGDRFYVIPSENEGKFQIHLDVPHPSHAYQLRIGINNEDSMNSGATKFDFVTLDCLSNPYFREENGDACPKRVTLDCSWDSERFVECGHLRLHVFGTNIASDNIVSDNQLPASTYFLAELRAGGRIALREVLELELHE